MKPITFENLRRLVGGGRKKKDKESFKRSDSFKRISIRRSYLDRGKKKHISKLEVSTQTVTEEEEIAEAPPKKFINLVQIEKRDVAVATNDLTIKHEVKCGNKYKLEQSKSGPGQSVIAYGQWLRGIRKSDTPNPSGIKGSERTIIYVPASDEITAPPVIRQLSSSPVLRKKPASPKRKQKQRSPSLHRKESNDSAVEMFPWGDSTDIKKSPLVRRRSRQSPLPLLPDSGAEELCSLSISLGRIWMDAPTAMAPRSLEMPKSSVLPAPVHHSLDSALKDLRDDPIVINRLQKRPTPPVGRTLSSTSNTTASTGLFSSKDSGFSFSISAPKLSDFHSNFAPSTSRGLFRKKRPKPKLSVSRDGYFKRTSGALVVDTKRSSVRRKNSGRKRNKKKKSVKDNGSVKSDMYQVVVSRPSKSLRALKLDPMIFVPPERRKTPTINKPSFKCGLSEIRNVTPLDNSMYTTRSACSTDEGLYESLPGEYDYLSDELSYNMSRLTLTNDEYDNFACGSPISEKSNVSVLFSDSSKSDGLYMPPGVSPVPKRKPVRQKKTGLSHKRSITYVVKPTIIRAPSTLRRQNKKGDLRSRSGRGKKQFISISGKTTSPMEQS